MAESKPQGPPGEPKRVEPDPLVEEIVGDPSRLPDAKVLRGYPGRSDREGYWRIYTSIEFRRYVEGRDEDLLAVRKLPPETDPVGRAVLWVRSEAVLRVTRVDARQIQAQFLGGPIASDFLREAGIHSLPDFVGAALDLCATPSMTFYGETCNDARTCSGWKTCKYGLTLAGCTCALCPNTEPGCSNTFYCPTKATYNCPGEDKPCE